MMDLQQPKKIILVDDQITNLTVGREALSKDYNVFTVPSGDKLLMLLKKITPDLILLDIEMPGMNGYETIKVLKENPETEHIPVVFLTARDDAGSELKGFSLGAIDYISKPFSAPLLLKRIEVHLLVEDQKKELKNYNDNLEEMVKQKTETIFELQNAIMETMAELVEYRDYNTGGHIGRTRRYLKVLIDEILEQRLYYEQVSNWNINQLLLSAQLHDIGKIAISDSILRKPGRLTDEEFEEMKNHTTFGRKVIEKIEKKAKDNIFLEYAKIFTECHHEKWDGSGYPNGLSGKDIPLLARIIAIVDVYDALVSERPYKKPFTHEQAIKIIAEGKDSHFESALVDLFLNVSDRILKVRGDDCA